MIRRSGLQHGAVLLVSLCVLLVLLMLGVSAARGAINTEKSARGERDRQVALQAAEAALADAERDIDGASGAASARARMFAPGSVAGFVDGCGAGADNLGLCKRAAAHAAPAWQRTDLAERSIAYGHFTGAHMPFGRGTLPARAPRYLIELMPYERVGEGAGQGGNFYRITAIGFGANDATRVVLQTYYLKAGPLGAAP
jgi:Tfp pilus assembly protein PilX